MSLDLNLLVVLHAVLEERSATRAAKKLHVTQSAVSNALARLRAVVGDPLVVRSGKGLVPTPRAAELAPAIADAMEKLEAALDRGKVFAPETSTQTFTLAAADNNQARDVPLVAAAFARALPRATLRIVSADYLVATDGLATGAVDVAIVPAAAVLEGCRSEPLFDETSAFLVRRDHPKSRSRLTPKLFAELSHIDVEVSLGRRGVGGGLAARAWKNAGLVRNVALVVPYFSTAVLVAARTDLVAGVPLRAAEVYCKMLPLRTLTPTFPMPALPMVLSWHERTNADPGSLYLRRLVLDTLRADAGRPVARGRSRTAA